MTATILIIDDDKFTREVLRKILERAPQIASLRPKVFLAADGVTGIELFERERPGLVIVDLFMPKMDGFAVCKRLRELATADELTIAVTSGVYKDATISKKIEQDYSAHFFAKPYQVKDIPAFALRALAPQAAAQAPSDHSKSAAPHPQRAGDLATRNVAALLWDLFEREATGRLLLRRGQVVRQIDLFVGHPVSVTTNVREETLGHFLVARGVIDSRAHREAMATAAGQNMRLGETLISMGLLSPRQLIKELTAQMRFKLVQALRWREGSWDFRPSAAGNSRGNPLDIAEVIVSGLASSAPVAPPSSELLAMQEHALRLSERGERVIEQLGRSVSTAFAQHFQQGIRCGALRRLGVSDRELYTCLDVLLACDGLQAPVDTGAPTAAPPTDAPARARASSDLYAALFESDATVPFDAGARPLANLDAVDPPSAPEQEALELDSAKAVETAEAVAVSVSFAKIPQIDLASPAQQDLISEFLRIQEKSLYQVLEIEADADLAAIEASYRAHSARFAKERFAGEELGRDYQKLDVLQAAYEQAWQLLSDPEQRQRYDDALFSTAGAMPGAPSLDAELVFRDAEEQLLSGAVAEAIVKLQASVAMAPHEAAYRATLGWALFAGGNQTEAAAELARPHLHAALALAPDSALVHEYLGRMHALCGDDADAAIAHLRKALDDDPRRAAALAALETLHLGRGEFAELEAVYRRILFQLAGDSEAEAAVIWSRLGDLQRHYMHDDAAALEAYRRARDLAPHDPALQETCAQLRSLAFGPHHADAESLLRSWQEQPTKLDPLHDLLAQAEAAQLHDSCFLTASVLVACGQDEPPATTWYRRHRARFVVRAQQVINTEIWGDLLHPDDDARLGALFARLAPVIETVAAPPGAAEELAAAAPVEEAALPPAFREVRGYLAHQLRMPVPRVCARADYGRMISVVASHTPTLLVGYDMLTSTDKLEICFRLGRAMSYLRPGRAIAAGSPPRTLKSAMLACYTLAAPDAKISDPDGQLQAFQVALAALDGGTRAKLQALVMRISRDHPTLNLSRWAQHLARTAARVGLVLCGDIPLGKRITGELSGPAAATELLAFAASPQHLQIRRALGLGIEV